MNYQQIVEARFKELLALTKPYKELFPQKSKIRLELPIKDGTGRYIYDLKEMLANNISTFNLNRNDVVVPNAFSFFIQISHVVNGTKVSKLYPYAPKNDGVHPSVHAVGFTTDAIDNLYNGHLQWLVGTTEALAASPMEDYLRIPRQQGAFVLDSQDAAVQEGVESEWSIENALQLVYPKYIIAGTQDHKMTVNFDAAGLTFPLNDANYTAELVLYMDVFLIKNGTQLYNSTGEGPFKEASGAWS